MEDTCSFLEAEHPSGPTPKLQEFGFLKEPSEDWESWQFYLVLDLYGLLFRSLRRNDTVLRSAGFSPLQGSIRVTQRII